MVYEKEFGGETKVCFPLYVESSLADAFDEKAIKEGVSRSKLGRQMIRRFLGTGCD